MEFFVKQPIMAWAGGAVSGLMLGGAASGINAAQQAQYRGELRETRDKLAKYAETLPEEVRPQAPDDKALTEKALEQYRREIELARLKTAAEALPEAVRPWAPTEPTPEALERYRQRLEEAQYRAQLDYALEADALGELGELWEDEAAFMKKVAEEERYSIKYPAYSDEDIRENSVRLQKMSPVVELTGKEFPKGEKDLMTQVLEFFESLGNNVYSEDFGDVGLTKSSWRSERRHGMTPVKAISFAAVPDVIQKGAVVNVRTKANAYDRIVVAAPINIANEAGIPERYIMGVMLQRDNQSQRLYLHDVVLEKNQDLQNHAQTGPNAKFDNQTSWSSANLDISTILRNALAVKAEPVRTLSEEIQRQMMQRGEGLRREQSPRPTAADGGAELRGLSLPTLEDGSGRKGSFGSPLLAQEDRVQGGMRNGQAEGAARAGAAEIGAGGGAYARGDAGTPDGAVYGGDGGGRFADAYAGGAGALRGARGGSKDNTRLIQARQRAAAEQPLLSSAELGASAGTEARTLQVVPEGEWDADLRESADFAYANGINEFVPVVGMLTADTGSGAVEVLDIIDTGSGRMIIKADSVKRSVAEVVRHAVVHYAAGEQHVRAFMQEVQSRYRPEAWSRMYETYRARWAPLTGDYAGMTAEQTELYVWEEIMGDAYAGVNNYGTRASVYSAEARRAMGGAIRTVQADQSAAALAERAGAVAQENSEALRRDGEAAERYSIASTLEDDLNSVYSLTYAKPRNEIVVGNTSQFLIDEIGARSLPVTMPFNKAYSAMATVEKAKADGMYRDDVNYHGLGPAKLKAALEASENPVAAFAAEPDERGKRDSSIVLVTDVMHNGTPVIVVEEVDTIAILNGRRKGVNKVVSSYDRTQIFRDIDRAVKENRLLHFDKKRSQALAAGVPGGFLPGAIQKVDFKKNIQDFWSGVKWAKSGKTTFTAKSAEPEVSPMQLAIQKGLEEKRQRDKQRQLDVINRTNPAPNSYNTWVRSVEDIKTLVEAVREPEWDGDVYNEDWTRAQALAAIEKDSVTLYSSQPIKNGVFVTPSRMEAESYSGDGRVYTKTVSPDKVAWIDPTQGQYADTELRGLSLPTLEETESTERFSVEDTERGNPAPYAGDPSAARQSRSAQDDSLTAESGGLRGLSLPTPESDELTDGTLRRAALAQGDSTPEASEAVQQAVRKVEPPEGYGTVSSYVADAMAREERGRAVRLEETAKDDFTGTEALMKLGVKIDRGVGIYQGIEQLRDIDRAAKQIERALKRAERRLEATEAERSFASGVAAGLYAEEDIPSRLDADKVMELADYYMAAESVKGDRIRERRRTIERINEEKMEKLFAEAEDEPDKTAKRLALIKMNYRTPERNMRHIFGDALGERINEAIFYPVQRNEAERFRFKQRMLDAVRTFEGEDGKRRRLSRAESALVQQLLEGDAARDEAERSA